MLRRHSFLLALAISIPWAGTALAQNNVTLKPGASSADLAVPLPAGQRRPDAVKVELQFDRSSVGARVAVKAPNGDLLGSIAPFGERVVGLPQSYVIPLTGRDAEAALSEGQVKLRFELQENDPNRSVTIRSVETIGPP